MSGQEKQSILDLRRSGKSSGQIAELLGLSVNTVKSICRRNSLTNIASNETGNKEFKELCKHCGKKLNQRPNTKPRVFCDDHCRFAWWNEHRSELNRKAVTMLSCAFCGSSFESYERENRKYCGHACYITHRFGKETARIDTRAV